MMHKGPILSSDDMGFVFVHGPGNGDGMPFSPAADPLTSGDGRVNNNYGNGREGDGLGCSWWGVTHWNEGGNGFSPSNNPLADWEE